MVSWVVPWERTVEVLGDYLEMIYNPDFDADWFEDIREKENHYGTTTEGR
jgi:hypothetical protein